MINHQETRRRCVSLVEAMLAEEMPGIFDPDSSITIRDGQHGQVHLHADIAGHDENGWTIKSPIVERIQDGRAFLPPSDDVLNVFVRRIRKRIQTWKRLGRPVPFDADRPQIGHLNVDTVILDRIRRDGRDPLELLRSAVAYSMAARRARQGRTQIDPWEEDFDIAVSGRRISGRFLLGNGIFWKHGDIVLPETLLPSTLVQTCAGSPAQAIMTHPLFEGRDDVVVLEIVGVEKKVGATTVLRMASPSMKVSSVWPEEPDMSKL